MPFEEGQSGNPNGRPKSVKQFKDALTLAVKRTDGDKTKLAQIAEALVERAMAGDVSAIREVGDRLDGKSAQPVGGDDDLGPILHRIENVIIDHSKT
jgi:hypothetical protein